jgi:simple sugar transport system permease protein
VGELTAVLEQAQQASKAASPEVVTLENLRSVSRGRSLGLGIATVILGVIEVWIFGFRTNSSLQSTIDFSSNTATSVPALSSAMRVVVIVLGILCIAGGVVLLVRHRLKALAVLLLVVGALLCAWVVALLAHVNGSGDQLKTLTVPVAGTAWLFGGITIAAGIALIIVRFSKAAFPIFFAAVALFLLSFLIWVSRGSNVGTVPALELTGILGLAFISATPLIYGSLSGVLCERSGVVNIAVEGQFMLGAMGSAMVASVIGHSTGGLVSGTIAAAVLGGLLGTVLAYMALHFKADQIIVGVVIVAFCTGLTQFMMSQVLDSKQWLNQGYGAFPMAIPGLSKIPFFGPILFDQTYFVYLAVILVALANYGLFRTRWGLRVRSVGEKPRASETVGLNVLRIKYSTVILGGVIAGIGGAVFTIGQGIPFEYGITNGEGFIALAIMIFGRWRPWGALSATMLFGFTIAIGSQLNLYSSQIGVPTELISALPYIITIAAVAGLVGRIRPPAADGVPYSRE